MTEGHHQHHTVDAALFVEQAVAKLRAHGGRVTQERRSVLHILAQHHDHLSADAVAEKLGSDHIHRATVFRSLEAFAEAGIVTHRQDPGGATAYHLATRDHLHAHCTSCGSVSALPADAFDLATARLQEMTGFAFDANRSALSGLCSSCRHLGASASA